MQWFLRIPQSDMSRGIAEEKILKGHSQSSAPWGGTVVNYYQASPFGIMQGTLAMLIFQVLTYSHFPYSIFHLYQLHCSDSILRTQGGKKKKKSSGLSPAAFQTDVNILSTWETIGKTERNGDKLRKKQWNYFNVDSGKKKKNQSHLLTEVELVTFLRHPTR